MNIERLVSNNYNADTKCINLDGKLRYLTNNEKLEVIRYIGDNYPDLQELGLWGNRIMALGDSLNKLINLQKLLLWDNEIKTLGNSFDKLVNLQFLNLSWNKIKTLGNSLDKIVNLQILYLHQNKIIKLDNSLDKLVNLQNLFIYNNKIPLVQIYNYVIFTEKLTKISY